MWKTKFLERKILQIPLETESGVPVPELCRSYGYSNASFYSWRSKNGGLNVSSMRRLKKMCAESQMDAEILKDALTGKY